MRWQNGPQKIAKEDEGGCGVNPDKDSGQRDAARSQPKPMNRFQDC
jgi:hypothetical protein